MKNIQQAIKWTVYTLLIVNFVFYIMEDWDRAVHSLNQHSTFLDWTSKFSASIDETGWFLLLFIFELETYALSDKAWKGWVAHTIRAVRLFCYALIAHSIYAYSVTIADLNPTLVVEGISDLCMITDDDVSYVHNLKYTYVTAETCADLSGDSLFFWASPGVVTDASGLQLERDLAWVDLLEAVVWLLILLVIEMLVRLQARGISRGPLIAAGNVVQMMLYLALLTVGVYWATLSHWLYFWDELLWIGGFAAIEMNLSDWRGEIQDEKLLSTADRDVADSPGDNLDGSPVRTP